MTINGIRENETSDARTYPRIPIPPNSDVSVQVVAYIKSPSKTIFDIRAVALEES